MQAKHFDNHVHLKNLKEVNVCLTNLERSLKMLPLLDYFLSLCAQNSVLPVFLEEVFERKDVFSFQESKHFKDMFKCYIMTVKR